MAIRPYRSCFCNGDLRPAPKTLRLKRGVLDPIFLINLKDNCTSQMALDLISLALNLGVAHEFLTLLI